jgi:hypothetical protein
MILVAIDHARHPVEQVRRPLRGIGQPVPWLHAVGLDIGFINDIEAVPVAQLIPPAQVRVMAGAHRIDIRLLEQTDVGHHLLFRYRLA